MKKYINVSSELLIYMGERFEITIKFVKRPEGKDFEDMIEWLCQSLGLVKGRDMEKTSAKIMLCFLKKAMEKDIVTAEEIAEELKIARSTVIHHMKKYEKAGMIVKIGSKYELRERNLEETIKEMEKDVIREFEKLKKIAKKIDDSIL